MIRDYKHTYKELSRKYGISVTKLQKRAFANKVKGRVIGSDSTVYFTDRQASVLLAGGRTNYKQHPRNIAIAEAFLSGMKRREIPETFKMSTRTAYEVIRELIQEGTVTVESRLSSIMV